MSKQDTAALRDLYYDKGAGLSSFDKLWRKVKKQDLGFTRKEVPFIFNLHFFLGLSAHFWLCLKVSGFLSMLIYKDGVQPANRSYWLRRYRH